MQTIVFASEYKNISYLTRFQKTVEFYVIQQIIEYLSLLEVEKLLSVFAVISFIFQRQMNIKLK